MSFAAVAIDIGKMYSSSEWNTLYKDSIKKSKWICKKEMGNSILKNCFNHLMNAYILSALCNKIGSTRYVFFMSALSHEMDNLKVKDIIRISKESGIPIGILTASKRYLRYKKEEIF